MNKKVASEMFSSARFFLFSELFDMFNESVYNPAYITLYLKVLNAGLNGYDEETSETYLITVKFDGFNFDIVELKCGKIDLMTNTELFNHIKDYLLNNCCCEIRKIAMRRFPYVSVYREEIE